ncbi:hypothetical protein D6779_11280 [Candidatus Parcubacteria bacterium]|nr:MAG: hypothetical protein D6779_11280 [Candidatus Parcubacteria bacterium]
MWLKFAKWCLIASLLVPIFVARSTFFPFIGIKDYFFRLFVELALIGVLLWWAFEADQKETTARLHALRSPLFLAVSIFVLVFLLATLFAYDPVGAFWSNYERGEGGFQMLHYYLFFSLLLVLFRDWKEWRQALGVFLVAATLMILYGVASVWSPGSSFSSSFVGPFSATPPDKVPHSLFVRLFGGARFQGSLGNPAYVAPYLMFAMAFAFLLWLGPGRRIQSKLLRTVGYGFLIAFFLLFFVLSQTRGAFLGMGAAVVVAVAYLAVRMHGRWRRGAVVALVLLALAGGTMYALRDTPWMRRIPLTRIFRIGLHEQTVQTRLWTWGSAWKGFLERPILGWGPENFSAVFDKYFDTRHFSPNRSSETWFDRAHSIYFDYLAETGILGLLAFLGIWGTFFFQFFKWAAGRTRERRMAQGEFSSPVLQALFLAVPVGYLVQGIAIFDVLPIYLGIFFFLALSQFLFSQQHHG